MKKEKEITIYNNYEGYEFDDVKKAYLLERGLDDVDDFVIWHYISFLEQDDFDIMLAEFTNWEKNNDKPQWLCIGTFGSWRGCFEGGAVFDSFKDMIRSITKDCEQIKVTLNNGIIEIECSHHDGTNKLTAKPLTINGSSLHKSWVYGLELEDLSQKEFHQKLWKSYTQKTDYFIEK